MPLAFNSISHGRVVFGFFNIEVDLLLLETCIFGAEEFCAQVSALADNVHKLPDEPTWQVYFIEKPSELGNLRGAITGRDYTGFIGEVYRMFPFPHQAADFKQKPDGARNRVLVLPILENYARPADLPVRVSRNQDVCFGPYRFERTVFRELVKYVWLGGYPRWAESIRPDYVTAMRKRVDASEAALFQGMDWE